MQQWKWSKANEKDLAKFVNGDTVKLFDKLGVNRFDLSQTPDGRRELVKAIYNTLVARNINYAYEQYQAESETQIIRPPHEILDVPGEGTCLDLAALFCGLCLGYELLPLLIIIEGHALTAVSLDLPLNQWNEAFNSQRNLFNTPQLFEGDDNLKQLQQLIDNESYLAIECTGFARTQSFGNSSQPEAKRRKADGTLSFDSAISAGREQLENNTRPFKFAIDIATAHYHWKIEPLTIRDLDATEIKTPAGKSVFYINHVEASGKGAVAIGGDANGATIITGNGNVVGNNNTVQRGKYNINLGSAQNLHIGDNINTEG
jgi:hypothetical protein